MRAFVCIISIVLVHAVTLAATSEAASTSGAAGLFFAAAAEGGCGGVPPCLNGNLLKNGYPRKFR